MDFDEWVIRKFDKEFIKNKPIDYFRMQAAFDAGKQRQKSIILAELLMLAALENNDEIEKNN